MNTPGYRNILLVIDSLHCGGAQRQLCYLAYGLKSLGHEVGVFVYHAEHDFFKKYLEERSIPIIYGHRKSKIQTIRHIAKAAKKGRYRWIISYLDGPNFYSIGAKQIGYLSGHSCRVCVSDRSSTDDGTFRGKEKFFRKFYRLADLVTANSEYHATTLRNNFPAISSRVHAIMNCVDDRFFDHRIDPGVASQVSPRTFAVVGQIKHGKNLHGLVEAMKLCKQKMQTPPKIKWAGRVGEGAEDYFQQQLEIIRSSELDDHFEFLGSVDDIPAFLKTTQGLVHPSLREGLPNVVCEAMVVGLPVAIGDISDARILAGQDRGLLFDVESAEAIAEAIEKLATLDDLQWKKMSQAAMLFADDNFKIETMARKYLAALDVCENLQ